MYHAMPKGIVPSTAKTMLENESNTYGRDEYIKTFLKGYKSIKETDLEVFSETDIQALDLIIKNFGNLPPQKLSELSHKSPEWKRFENLIEDPSKKSSYPIDIFDFFINLDEKNGLFVDNDEFLALSKGMFEEMN